MSAIDPTQPPEGEAYTAPVRANFQAAADELDALAAAVAAILAKQTYPMPAPKTGLNGTEWVLASAITAASIVTGTPAANRLALYPFRAQFDGTITAMAIRTGSTDAGTGRFGIYAATDTQPLLPTSLQYDSGNLDFTASGMIAKTLDYSIQAGQILFLATLFQGTPSCYYVGSNQLPPFIAASGGSLANGPTVIYATYTYGALPLDLTGQSWTASNINTPAIAFKFA